MPQFNKKETGDRWYNMTYQSNHLINDDLHGKAKQFIAKIIKDHFAVREMHSYIHGEIVFRISTSTPVETLNQMVQRIEKPFAEYKPNRLFYSITLATTISGGLGKLPIHIMYIEGDTKMDSNFLLSIKDFHANAISVS